MIKRKVTRAAVYVRHAKLESREDQLRACRQRAAEAHYEIVGTYQDEGSANLGISERPGLRALLEDASNHKVDVVLMDTADRLARKHVHMACLFGRLEEFGVRLVTLDEGEMRRLSIPMSAVVSRHFLDEVSRKARGLRLAAKRLNDDPVGHSLRRQR